ncbi:hypothetical protein PN290_13020 [Romboutsia sp. 1001216sp1]|uniref:hypothetical protein n=1 Tax=unclassified Romboutsia TaxID=2626894 RepID=UPI0018A07078|nr:MULTISPECIES: hypothetical protein [unclassified Romboutsia]MDB8791416.1 hypothetical protein [Romboutsia sp. 1001216sp1]MDB8794869.1 hypothetical protein [Romboutsia sp. 1001216sp1]MDB8797417.1 hypothetical protein [Romboutsia sp. 1001216sp1]MDB8800294.1 hypothetical protein [Romboutsia sp. 1001216sp1]MDB8803128.1 hypothetical protein [Romboutsia sp. 1001216sp1]
MFEMVKFPYNARPVARLDANNIVHNHLYHDCPIGKVCDNVMYDLSDNPIGRVEEDGTIHSHHINNSPIGKVNSDGYISKGNDLVGRIDCNNQLAGGAYLLLIHDNR